jgi:hypothetical protein
MKNAVYLLISLWLPWSVASAQSQDLRCKTSLENPDSKVPEAFIEGYVAAFGFPEAGGYKARIEYLKTQPGSAVAVRTAQKQMDDYLKLDLKTQHRLYLETQIQNRIGYLKPYLQAHNCRLSDVEAFAISIYSGSAYDVLFRALGGQKPAELSKYGVLIGAINAGLEKLEPYAGMVRSGQNLSPSQAQIFCEGCTVTMNTFFSTTIGNAYRKRTHQLMIKPKTGAYIAPLSSAIMEEEVLFKSGTKFKVIKVENDGHLITMEEI